MRGKTEKFINYIKDHKMSLLILAVFVIMAVSIRSQEQQEAGEFQGVVEREAETGNTQNRSFSFHLEEGDVADEIGEQELEIEVSPLQLDREEAFELLDEAVSLWEASYLGDNGSADEVLTDLVLPASFCDDLVSVSYESSDYEVLQTDGTVTTESLDAGGEIVELTARFSYGDYTRIETAGLKIMPPEEGSAEWVIRELEREVSQTEEDSREEESFSLPDAVAGYRVIWEPGDSSTWVWFLLLGVVAFICLEMRGRQEERDRLKKRNARLELEYPQMVDQFEVLLESGMTIRKAWERILMRDRLAAAKKNGRKTGKKTGKKKQTSGVYLEEMWITYLEIREGRGEKEAYERFGKRIGLMPYKRFSSILTQNLSKGTQNVKELLKKESEEALEMRKTRARKLGEEAGSKMLFPMLVMMCLILLILLVPALTSL